MVTKQTIERQLNEANKFAAFLGKSSSDLFKLNKDEREILLLSYAKPAGVNNLIRAGIERSYEASEEIIPLSEIDKRIHLSDSELLRKYKYYSEAKKEIEKEIEIRGLTKESVKKESICKKSEYHSDNYQKPTNILAEKLLIPKINIVNTEYVIDQNPKHFDGIKVFTEKNVNAQRYLKDINYSNYENLSDNIKVFNESNNDTIDKVRISIKLRLSDGSEQYFSSKKLPTNEAIQDISEKIRMILERDSSFAFEISAKFEDMIKREKIAKQRSQKYVDRVVGIYYDYYRKEIEPQSSE